MSLATNPIAIQASSMKLIVDLISGKFVKDWMLENRVNQTSFKAMHAKCDAQKRWANVYALPWIAEPAGRL